jgi:hypothetical protein
MSVLKFVYGLASSSSAKDVFAEFVTNVKTRIAKGTTGAIRTLADQVKKEARSSIGSGGFSARWQNALRVNVYPKSGFSVNAAAYIFHKIDYAGVFEYGKSITGKPLMWLPTQYAQSKVAGRHISPKLFTEYFGLKLRATRGTGRPLLVADIALTKSLAGKVAAGTKANIGVRAIRKSKKSSGPTVAVPMFVGISRVQERKMFDIVGICNAARSKLAGLYKSIVGNA